MSSLANTSANTSLAEQRRALRGQLAAQRQLIAQQLEPKTTSGYPRSMTMRFLTRRSVPAAKIIAGLSALLIGLRFFRAMTATLAIVRGVRSVVGIGHK